MKRSIGVLLVFAIGLAQADNVSFELENAGSITGYLTLSGSDIVVAQTSYSSDVLTDYEISLSFDYGDGSVDFEVTGGSFVLTNGGTYPSAYFGYGTSLQLSETITDPGETTNWTFEQVENGDITLTLHNLATDDEYISVNPSAGDHIWRLIETRVPMVEIDFLPFNLSGNNNIDPEEDRQVSVAVFTTSIADGDDANFDAAMIDRNTATFGPLQPGKTQGGAWLTDIDEDLDVDMVLKFENLEVGFLCEDSEAVLEGRTLTGDYFVGADFVATPLCDSNVCHADPAPSRDTSRLPQKVVFMATDPADSNNMHLYSAKDNGSSLMRLSPDWPAGFEDADMGGFLISPDKDWVVFARSYLDVAVSGNNVAELFVSAIDGSSRVQVNSNVPSGIWDFEWSPDSGSIAYIADEDVNGERELYVVGENGTGHVKINGPLPAGGDVFNGIVWSPDSSQIAYVSDQTTNGQAELWTGAADGSVRVKASKVPAPGAVGVLNPIWSPDGSTIMYMGALDSPGVLELYAVKPDGSDHATVSGTMVSGGGVYLGGGHQWSSDSMHILYVADQETDGQNELFVGVADGTSNVKVNGVLGADADVYPAYSSWDWSPDGTRATYETYDSGTSAFAAYLWTESTGINIELNAGSETRVLGTAWSPNGLEFAYFSDEVQDNTWQNLYISSADGTSTTKVSGTMSTDGGISYVFYRGNGMRTVDDGWSPDGSQYLYLADQNVDGINELFVSAADGSSKVKVSEAVATGLGLYYRSQGWSPDGKKVIFVKEAGGTFSLYSNDNIGGTPINLSGDLDIIQSELIRTPPSY